MRRTSTSWFSTIAKLGFHKPPRRSRSRNRHSGRGYFRHLRGETLESRHLLSASMPEVVTISWANQTLEVLKDQWLVDFGNAQLQEDFQSNPQSSGLGSSVTFQSVSPLSTLSLLNAPGIGAATIESWAAQNQSVFSVEPNVVSMVNALTPNDPSYGSLWGLDSIDAPNAWEYTTGSRANVIGVIDTGVDYRHPDLYLNIWVNQHEVPSAVASQLVDVDADGLFTFVDFNDPLNASIQVGGQFAFFDWNGNGYIDAGDLLNDGDALNDVWEDGDGTDSNGLADDIVGWDFVSGDNDPLDDYYHGTHVAGTIGAVGNNGVGVTGVNWAVSLIPLKAGYPLLDTQGRASIPESAAIAAIDYASALRTNDGNHVVATNNSWGGLGYTNNLRNAITRAGNADVLFVASAGNSGFNTDVTPHYPASFPNANIISVASMHPNGSRALGSNYGPNTVDLAAPGVSILSTLPVAQTASMQSPYTNRPPFYGYLSGTSMAAPHVAGVAALLAAWNPEAGASMIKQAIMDGVAFSGDFYEDVVTDGVLNAAKALSIMPKKLIVSTAVDESDGNYGTSDLSLREALEIVDSFDTANITIEFDPSLYNSVITLAYDGPDAGTAPDNLVLTKDVRIVGPGSGLISISGNSQTRVFQINSDVTATISGLKVTAGNADHGGGIRNEGHLTLTDVIVSNSVAGSSGGGIMNSGSLYLELSQVNSNSAALGGGIYTTGGLTLQRSQIDANQASGYGGGLHALDPGISGITVSVNNSTISNNTSGFLGGGAYLAGPYLDAGFLSSTISANQSVYHGGGIYEAGGWGAFVFNSTVAGNSSQYGSGGGIYGTVGVSLSSSIVAGNSGNGGLDIDGIVGGWGGRNLIGFDSNLSNGINHGVDGNQVGGENGALAINAMLAPLGYYGGATRTHALLPGSPAIDKGDSFFAQTDQRGFALPVDEPGTPNGTGDLSDVGAFEFAAPIIVTTLADESDGNLQVNDISLREALTLAAAIPGNDVIRFNPSLFATGAQSLVLSFDSADAGSAPDLLSINTNVTIEGPGADKLSISGNYLTQVFGVASGTTATIRDLTITGGIGTGVGNAGNLTLERVTVSHNQGSAGGGIFSTGAITIISSTIEHNTAVYIGGGIAVSAGSATILNSTISNNTTTYYGAGAGIYNNVAGTTLINTTVSQNTSAYGTGGIASNGGLILLNSIVAGNVTGSSTASDLIGGINTASSRHNLIGHGGSGGIANGVNGNIVLTASQSPGLADLGFYGGTTRTHALLPSSPAIDRGRDASVPGGVTTDQRGFARFLDDSAVANGSGGIVDIGAVEFVPLVVSTLADENDGNFLPGDLSLREAMLLAQIGNIITFDSTLFSGGPGTITLAFDGSDSGTAPDRLVFDRNLTIVGPGADLLSISGNNQTGVFLVNSGITATIRNVTIKNGNHGSGGGIASTGNLTLDRVAIESSTATAGGGIDSNGVLVISNSTISGNQASFIGSGIHVGAGAVTIVNSTISSNTGGGGGIYVSSGNVSIVNSTVTLNSFGVFASSFGTQVILSNSIVAGNTGNNLSGSFNVAASWHNLIGNVGTGGFTNGTNGNIVLGSGVSAGLTSLGYYGGPTKTHALLSTSAAIDAGDNAVALAYLLDDDQRGEDRVVDWLEDDLEAQVDIGAVELVFDEIYS